MTINKLEKLLSEKEKYQLGFFPTPLHRLDHISEDLGINLYIKRDDLSGRSAFGGNKIRKLEYLIGDAKKKGAEYVFTYGATESNHAMQTITACRQAGLKPVVYLTALVPVDEKNVRSNLFLDQIMGAEIHIVNLMEGETEDEADERAVQIAHDRQKKLEAEGHCCYDIPMGGADAIGTIGFINGYLEYHKQMAAMNYHADCIFHATGTAGTMAGLAAGKKLLNDDTEIISVNVSEKDESYSDHAVELAEKSLEELGIDGLHLDPAKDVVRETEFFYPGYELPGKESTEAICYLAEREGILIDPVYSGKAFAALLSYARSGRIAKGSTVVFWHTGGACALFAEEKIVGSFENRFIFE